MAEGIRCGDDAGSQYDPCHCRLDLNHGGACWCEHLGTPDPRTVAAPAPTEGAGRG